MKKKPVCTVLGGSGFLGFETLPVLRKSYEVIATSMRPRDGFEALDLRDCKALATFMEKTTPDVVIVLAAYRDPDYCEEHPDETRRLNTDPARFLARFLPPTIPILFVSTDYVFDGRNPPYREDAERRPVNEYGKSKVEAEDVLLGREHSIILRVPLLMGWTDQFEQSGFFSHLIADLKATEPRALDNILKRYPVWTRDVGESMVRLIKARASGAFHFSTVRPLTRFQAAKEMAGLIGWPTSHLIPSDTIIPRRAQRPDDAHLDMTGWQQRGFPLPTDFQDVARMYLEHFGILPG